MSGESWLLLLLLLLLLFHILTMSEIRLRTHPGPVYDTNANRLTIDFLLKVQQIWLRGFNDM